MLIDKSMTLAGFEPLIGSDKIRDTLDRMEKHEIYTLPVIDPTTRKLTGQVDFKQLADARGIEFVADLELKEAVKIYQRQHIFEAVRLMMRHELTQIPVVDHKWTFIGVIGRQEAQEQLSGMLNLASTGATLIVKLAEKDLSISEIVQIIETEGARIMGLTVEKPNKYRTEFELSFKLNLKNVAPVISALKRFGYSVDTDSSHEVTGDNLKSRADELLRYIDM